MASQADPDGGYILLYRRLLDNPVFRDDGEAMAFAWLVLKAAHCPRRVRYKDRPILLERGQLAVSVRDMAAKLGRSKDWSARFLERLVNRDMIATATATGISVITVCNYDIYQVRSRPSATVIAELPRQHRDSTATQNKELKELEEDGGGGHAPARESFDLIALADQLSRAGGVPNVSPTDVMRNTEQVRAWADLGVDPDTVILPTIRQVVADAGEPIRSLKYFDGPVRRALALKEGEANGHSPNHYRGRASGWEAAYAASRDRNGTS